MAVWEFHTSWQALGLSLHYYLYLAEQREQSRAADEPQDKLDGRWQLRKRGVGKRRVGVKGGMGFAS